MVQNPFFVKIHTLVYAKMPIMAIVGLLEVIGPCRFPAQYLFQKLLDYNITGKFYDSCEYLCQ